VVARAAAHVFVDDLAAPVPAEADAHHLARVLRLRPGQAVTVGDGAGRWRLCRVGGSGDSGVGLGLEPVGEVEVEPRAEPAVGVAFSLVKGERPEWIVQKLTEVGVDVIVPLAAARSVVRLDGERAARQVARWRRVAREAAGQSRRAWLPAVGAVAGFEAVAARPGAALAVPGGGPPSLERPLVLVGPEGGWAPEEEEAAARLGLPEVGLGPHVLRAETAAVAAATLLSALRFGLVRPPG
jgi:16S rRNA (uracil1498-N3)-methyltransferase